MSLSPSMLTNVPPRARCASWFVESSILARADGCRCEEYRIVQANIEAERKVADAVSTR